MSGTIPASTPRTELTHRRLCDAAKAALLKIFVHPHASVCELYCGSGFTAEQYTEASAIGERREAWESLQKRYTTDFFEIDPCTEELESHLEGNENQADFVCCLQHLQLCFESEDNGKTLIQCVVTAETWGLFFRAKYQKNVEAYHNRIASMKPGIVPNFIRSESYIIAFEVEEEKFPSFGKKYHLIFAGEISGETTAWFIFPA